MRETVTFGNVQVPVADVLAAAERIKAEREKPKPVEPGLYRLHHRTDADPFAGGYVVRRKNADGSWDQAQSWGEWYSVLNYSSLDQRFHNGSIVPLQPVEGVEYEGGDDCSLHRWRTGKWEFRYFKHMFTDWMVSCVGPDLWRTGQLRPVQPKPWTPKVSEWVQHKTEPWEKAHKVEDVMPNAFVCTAIRLENNEKWSASDVRPATPEEIEAAKRIELVDRLIVRCKADGGVWQYRIYGGVQGYWKKLSDNGCGIYTLDLDHYDVLDTYLVEGATGQRNMEMR